MPAEVKRSVEATLRSALGDGHFAAHVKPLFEGRRSPAWAADIYEVFVVAPYGDAPLEAMADVLRAMPGCREVKIRGMEDVQADMDRGNYNPVRWGVHAWLDPDTPTPPTGG
jgi:hypothetical protein